MNQVQRKRLKRFIAFLRKVNHRNFHIDSITNEKDYDDNFSSSEFFEDLNNGYKTGHSCNSTACIAGYMVIFNPRKFEYTLSGSGIKEIGTIKTSFSEIFSEYFGIEYDLGHDLTCGSPEPYGFDNESKVTPKVVARRLEQLL